MKLKATLFSVLLLAAGFAIAQDTPANGTSQPNTGANSTQDSTTTAAPDGAGSAATTDSGNSSVPNGSGNKATPGAGNASQSMDDNSGSQAAPSLTGCLSGSPSSGQFSLTEASGVTHALVGDDKELRTLVGSQIQVTGRANGASAASPDHSGVANGSASGGTSMDKSDATSAGTAKADTSFQVSTVRQVADHCTGGASLLLDQHGVEVAELTIVEFQSGSAGSAGTAGGQSGAASPSAGSTAGTPGTSTSPGSSNPGATGGANNPSSNPSTYPGASAPPSTGTATPQPGTATPAPGTATPAPGTATPGNSGNGNGKTGMSPNSANPGSASPNGATPETTQPQ
jgi:hypothetical protein